MIQKQTFLKTSDKTNIKWFKTIHLYKGFKRKVSTISFFIKGAARKVKPPKIEYKGFKRKFFKKGDIMRALIIKIKFKKNFNNYFNIKFFSNSTIVIKKKNVVRSKYFLGLCPKHLNRKKFILLFPNSI